MSVNVTAIGVVNGVPVPVAIMPATMPVVADCVTVTLPAVVPQVVFETAVSAPGFVVIVTACEAATVATFENKSSSERFDNLHEVTLNAILMLFIAIFDRLPQLENILDIFVTDAVLNSGTLVNAAQLENIIDIVVTDAVLNSGTLVNAAQLENILDIFVTDAVLNSGTLVNAAQLENILDISVTDAVLNNGTLVNERQLENILDIFVTDAVLNNGTLVNERQLENILDIVVSVPVVPIVTCSIIPQVALTVVPLTVMLVRLEPFIAISSQLTSVAAVSPVAVCSKLKLMPVKFAVTGVITIIACLYAKFLCVINVVLLTSNVS